MLKQIHEQIKNNNLEEAYNHIIENEIYYSKNSMYWALRGDLCNLISEYDFAIASYIKSLDIDSLNTYSIKNLIKIYELLNDYKNSQIYINILKEIEDEFYNENLLRKIASDFENVTTSEISNLFSFKKINWYYLKNGRLIKNRDVISIDQYIMEGFINVPIIVPYNVEYVKNVRYLAKKGVRECIIAAQIQDNIYFVSLGNKLMQDIKDEKYKSTVVLNRLNAGDSNVYALYKYMPKKYRDKYNIFLIEGSSVFDIDNIVKVPLISEVAISGHGTFLSYPYPQLMYNIEVGHGPMSFKAAGIMEKTYKNFAFTPQEYKNVDKVCVTSTMDMMLMAAFASIPEDKFIISGMPRTDTLLKSNGKLNLEKVLGIKLNNKKIIFNMPTFHTHAGSGKVDGNSNLKSFVKMEEFNYKEFDEFLGDNNLICVMKVHHAEEDILNNEKLKAKNIYFIFNKDLEEKNMDLYEILNASDLLITDYSSVYSDFLFMNKPCIFVNTDIDDYRRNRGLALEPYDFWTAGPKVQSQDNLQIEILKSVNNDGYYKEKRDEIRTVYHFNFDDKSSERVWNLIDDTISKAYGFNNI